MTAVIARPVTVKTKIGDLDLAGNLNLRRNSIFVGYFFGVGESGETERRRRS